MVTGYQVFGDTTIVDMLNYWADLGVFAYVLPFLLIFAVVYGILAKTEIFGKNKGVYAVIAIAVGLLSLISDYVRDFFSTIFPFAGVGLSILLVALILMGLFTDWDDKKGNTIFLVIGAIIGLIVIIASLTSFEGWQAGFWWNQYGSAIITLIIIIALVWMVIGFGKAGNSSSGSS